MRQRGGNCHATSAAGPTHSQACPWGRTLRSLPPLHCAAPGFGNLALVSAQRDKRCPQGHGFMPCDMVAFWDLGPSFLSTPPPNRCTSCLLRGTSSGCPLAPWGLRVSLGHLCIREGILCRTFFVFSPSYAQLS